MIRSLFLAILLSLSIAGLAISFWGKAELDNPQSFSENSSRVLSSPESRALLVKKITAEVWAKVDIQSEIEKLLPPEAEILSGPAETAAEGAFSAALDKILEQGFVENIWAPGVKVSADTSLIGSEQSALLVTKESVSLEISEVLRATANDLSLPSVIQNNIPNLGKVELAERQSAVKVQTAYNVLNVSPLVFLPLVLLLLASLFISERRTLWRGGLFLGGSLLLACLLLLFSEATLPAYFTGNISDPLSLSLAQYIWQDWSAGLMLLTRNIFLLSIPIIFLSILASPPIWQKLMSAAEEEAPAANNNIPPSDNTTQKAAKKKSSSVPAAKSRPPASTKKAASKPSDKKPPATKTPGKSSPKKKS